MADFNFTTATAGGLLIGLSSTLLLLFNGRIAGISGIVNGAISFSRDSRWRWLFIAGLLVGGWLYEGAIASQPTPSSELAPVSMIAGGAAGWIWDSFGQWLYERSRGLRARATVIAIAGCCCDLFIDWVYYRICDSASAIRRKNMMTQRIKQDFVALAAGIVFGVGLGLSQMVDRQRVLGFLDLAGIWDPTLLFVLLGAVAFTIVAFRFVLSRKMPLLGDKFFVPSRNDVDGKLIAGAALFGIGWGLSGYCPGPGITALVLGSWNPVLFVLALAAGMFAFQFYEASR